MAECIHIRIGFSKLCCFTIEFMEAFVRQYEAGIPPIKIVEGLGYDVELLGKRCINSLYCSFKKQQGLHEGSLQRKSSSQA